MDVRPIINAAGKLTALGGSAQSEAVADAQARAAMQHVDLAELRAGAGARIAEITGAEAACVTSGAAAGIAISVAAVITGQNLDAVRRLPQTDGPRPILLQAGHAVDFGATVEQMIRLGGGHPTIIGSTNSVPLRLLEESLGAREATAMLYVQSHHCVQENMISLPQCIAACHAHKVPVIVDAAAEEDLHRFILAGADLVTYSGGKAFGGPTAGFIAGKQALIAACELQFRGIGRTMKVGKEAISGLIAALTAYLERDEPAHHAHVQATNQQLLKGISAISCFDAGLKPDEAGRSFDRVSIGPRKGAFDIRDLVDFLAMGSPSIRTRNHHLDQGILLIDPRELGSADVDIILKRLGEFTPARS